MAQITVSPIEDSGIWEDFMSQNPEANFLHSWYWGEFHCRLGRTVCRYGFFEGDKLIGVLLAIVEPAKRGRHLIIPAGPIIDWENKRLVKAAVDLMKKVARDNKCVFVRIRPQLFDSEKSRQLFKNLGFRPAPMHLHAELTSQVDLTKSDDELKKAMRKGTRYEVNRAERLGIKVESTTQPTYLDEFYNLQLETAKRQNFIPFSKRFLSEQFKTFAEVKKVLMYKATQDGKLLTMAFVIFYGNEAAYHYGASTDLARKIPGAYAVQWQAIQEARRRGCKKYNFWGITEHGQTKHRFYGVSVFKRGFGGEDVAYLHAHDLVISPLRYLPNYIIEIIRKYRRHL